VIDAPGDNIMGMRGIFLVGFMGAGKTSVGEALAARLGRRFIDLDERVAGRFGMSIAEIFAARGEGAFRSTETEELARVAAEADAVVSTGGGAFCNRMNREIIRGSAGVSVYLDLPWNELDRRLSTDNHGRPKYEDTEQARRLFEQRRPAYLEADIIVALAGTESPGEVAERVHDALGKAAACGT